MDAALRHDRPQAASRRALALLLLGPPGAGKGTQSHGISRKFGIPEISTGEMLREAVRAKTELGNQVKSIMESGELVPDHLVCALVEQRLSQPDCAQGFILDGFPRNLEQARFLDHWLRPQCRFEPLALNIRVDPNLLIKRLTGRRMCPRCRTIYNIYFNPPQKDEICDKDSTPLVQRRDDSEAAIRTRVQEYEAQTKPLLDYYRNSGLLREVDGDSEPPAVTSAILRLLESL